MIGNILFRLNDIKPELIFVFIALVFGLAFVFINPPLMVPDEGSHLYKAAGLSEGFVTPVNMGGGSFVGVPEGIHELVGTSFNKYLTSTDFTSAFNIKLNKNKLDYVNLSGNFIVEYPPIPYAVAALTLKIGYFFDLAPLTLMYMVRIVNLLVWILLIYLAIKIIPIYKWVFLLLVLMPMTLYVAASISADSFTIGLTFLAIAYILKLTFSENNFRKTDFIILLILGILLTLSKSIYSLVFLLFLFIPTSKFNSYKIKYGIFLAIMAVIGLVSVAWESFSKPIYAPKIANYSFMGQLDFTLQHPINYLNTILHTFIINAQPYLIEFVGTFGWLEIALPIILVIIYIIVIVIASIVDKNSLKISSKYKTVSFLIFISIAIAVATFDYLTWTPVGTNEIFGIQGRYFIPTAPLLLLLLYNKREYISIFNKKIHLKMNYTFKLLIVEIIIITLITALLLIYLYFYTNVLTGQLGYYLP